MKPTGNDALRGADASSVSHGYLNSSSLQFRVCRMLQEKKVKYAILCTHWTRLSRRVDRMRAASDGRCGERDCFESVGHRRGTIGIDRELGSGQEIVPLSTLGIASGIDLDIAK